MDITKLKKVYMIGIKGVGMTMLAQYLAEAGVEVIGSDTAEKFMTDPVLKQSGIKVYEEFNIKNIPEDADIVIHSTAYTPERNLEVAQAAKNKNIKLLKLPEALGELSIVKYTIAVAGCHGKTTTTAWLGYVADMAKKNPSIMVGSHVPQLNGLSKIGASDLLILEADEYQNKLQFLEPKGVILTNIDYDHPDFFPDFEAYQRVFIDFIKKIPAAGFLVGNYDDPTIRKIAWANCRARIISYAINEAADYVAYDIKRLGTRQYFKVKMAEHSDDDKTEIKDVDLGGFSIQLPGKHNISNALAVIAAGIELKIELFQIRQFLEEFAGTARRMQTLGEYHGATVIDDYAHHPTEIKATLAGARELYHNRRLIVVFHPHTFTRTKALLTEFANSFKDVDMLIVLDIYGSAREEPGGVHSRDLVALIKSQSDGNRPKEIEYIATLKQAEEHLRGVIRKGDAVILMGAGDVFRIGENLVN